MLLHIKVKPNSKKDEVTREPDGTIKVKIKAPPVDGKANTYLIAFLAGYFGLPKSKIVVLKGQASQFKTIEIEANDAEVLKKLEEL